MQYEWKCEHCENVVTIKRPVRFHNKEPDEKCKCDKRVWKKVIKTAPGVPFQTLRDRGIFMDEHGNFPPRKLDA